jgi:hypothetical protein
LASSGSFLAPKSSMTMPPIIIASVVPIIHYYQ